MRIGVVNNNLLFASKKKNIRMADDVQRAARRTFYMFSPTYVDTFYKTSDSDSKYHNEITRTTSLIQERILVDREQAEFPRCFPEAGFSDTELSTVYAPTLKKISESHYGNCSENARAAVAALCANGYYNSRQAELYLEITFEDKNTGELSHPYYSSLDHSFAVTDMNEGGELNIVVDPWLGFADSKEAAIERFKGIYTPRDIDEPVSYAKYSYYLSRQQKGIDCSMNDFIPHTKFVVKLKDEDKYSEEDFRSLGDYTCTYFENVVLYHNEPEAYLKKSNKD